MSAVTSMFSLSRQIPPFSVTTTVDTVAAAFLDSSYEHSLSVAVVNERLPVGTISRHTLNQIFLQRYGRELYGQRPVTEFMNRSPLLIPVSSPLGDAATYLTEHMQLPLSEDFILTEAEQYFGMGGVLDLLGAVEKQLRQTATHLTRTLHQLRHSQMQLVHSEKMSALGLLTAGVAHEINTPLGYIQNNIELLAELSHCAAEWFPHYEAVLEQLQQPIINPHELRQQAETALENRRRHLPDSWTMDLEQLKSDTLYGVEQINELVQSLKNFSRQDHQFQDQVDFNTCIDNSLRLTRSLLKYSIEIVQQRQPLPPLRLQPSQINQVLLNLLTNAAQAMPDGGKILLKTWSDSDWVWFIIQDNGCGIAPEHLPHIFDPFFTTKPVGQGTGLGLSISDQIIRQHGGKIKVFSRPGKGTRFQIQFPRSADNRS